MRRKHEKKLAKKQKQQKAKMSFSE